MSDEEIALLAEAFRALRRDRGLAWNAACDVADAQGKRRPSLRPYGIDDIKRLARRFGITATHWSECVGGDRQSRDRRRLLAVAAEWNRKGA